MPGKPHNSKQVFDETRQELARLRPLFPQMTGPAVKKTLDLLAELASEVEKTRSSFDSIKDPGRFFDPGNPDTVGRIVAMALLAQDKVRLDNIASTYGSGVYVIYYTGNNPIYRPISNTETPIYVGKADPKHPNAATSKEQGPQLYKRLREHEKTIKAVSEYATKNNLPDPLRVEDFSCRRLVCATNAQLVAETHLITIFSPIWNDDTKICWGISKHGDAAVTRANARSPWHVIHPGVSWALAPTLKDKRPRQQILDMIGAHFTNPQVPIYRDSQEIIQKLLSAFVQHAAKTDIS